MNKSNIEKISMIFWTIFILTPMFTGWMMYQPLPNEFDERKHELLKSHHIECGTEGMQSCEVADVWRDDATGIIYNANQFKSHRRSEATRTALTVFIYGLIGCLFAAYRSVILHRASMINSMNIEVKEYVEGECRIQERGVFISTLKSALMVDFFAALFFYLMI